MKNYPNFPISFCRLWCMIALIQFFGVACSPQGKKAANIGEVTRADLVQRVTVPGLVFPNRKTVISAPYNGYIKKIFVQIGQKVMPGDPIVSVAQSLRNSGEEVFPLRAPFPGTVVQVLKTEGEFVDQTNVQAGSGNAIVRIDDLSKLFVEVTSPEVEINKLKEDQEVVIKASALLGKTYQGKIKHISLAAKEQKEWMDKSKVEFTATIEVTNADAQLKPGMSVIVDIITKKLLQVLTLRHEFIHKEGEEHFVTLTNGTKSKIQIGSQNDEVIEVLSGLKQGDQVQQTDFLSLSKGK